MDRQTCLRDMFAIACIIHAPILFVPLAPFASFLFLSSSRTAMYLSFVLFGFVLFSNFQVLYVWFKYKVLCLFGAVFRPPQKISPWAVFLIACLFHIFHGFCFISFLFHTLYQVLFPPSTFVAMGTTRATGFFLKLTNSSSEQKYAYASDSTVMRLKQTAYDACLVLVGGAVLL